MGVKTSHKSKGLDFDEMIQRMKTLDGKGVEVGVLKGEHKWLAGIHEFGCNIEITPKMRAYLRGRGLYLKKSTTHIRIPERSFLRTGYDKNRDAVAKKATKCAADVVAGKMTARGCQQAVGMELASKIKDHAIGLSSPGNHPFTVGNKGSSNPLVDSGDMIGGITWRNA